MERGVIKKEKLNLLLRDARKTMEVYLPVAGDKGLEFGGFTDGMEVLFEYGNTKLSPKGIFFPQTETLLTYEDSRPKEIPLPETSLLLFGSRPCDARANLFLDKVFEATNSRFQDPYYLKRRENSVVASLACREPCATCFCTTVGGGPASSEGSDILVHDLGDLLLFEGITKKGAGFMRTFAGHFSEANEELLSRAEEQAREAEAGIEEFDIEGLKENLDDGFNSGLWEAVTANCLGCGACTYLCPTCHCFDITDEDDGRGSGKRIRTWDSCQYPQFTLHASGHNPRTNKVQRMRQRVMHKFSYTVENTGDIYCVGCGRCVAHCPVNLDIREVLRKFAGDSINIGSAE